MAVHRAAAPALVRALEHAIDAAVHECNLNPAFNDPQPRAKALAAFWVAYSKEER